MNWNNFILALLPYPDTHAKFLNTLSLLEYLGARKILKSQATATLTAGTIAHAAEELRHAQVLKKFALHLSQGTLKTYADADLLCGKEAKQYLQAVDGIAREYLAAKKSCSSPTPPEQTAPAHLAYWITTWLIEERALQIYPAYAQILDRAQIPHPLHMLIRDEEAHLEQVRHQLESEGKIEKALLEEFREQERRYFEEWTRSLVKPPPVHLSNSPV